MGITKEIFVHELVGPGSNGKVLAKAEDDKDDPESHKLGGIISNILYEEGMWDYIPTQSVVERIKVTKLGPITLKRTQQSATPAFDQSHLR